MRLGDPPWKLEKVIETGEVKVPGVEGATGQKARERLAEAGFETEIRRRESLEQDAGRVLEQSVPSGKEAEKGPKTLLAVSDTPEVAKVPDLVGLSYPEAEWRRRRVKRCPWA